MGTATFKCSTEQIRTLTHAPSGAKTVDTIVLVNGLVCIACADVADGEDGSFIYQADEVDVTKVDGTAVTVGDPAYYDSNNDEFTPTQNANTTLAGVFLEDVASGTTTARIELNSQFRINSDGGLPLPAVVDASQIPTSDPAVAGQVWANSGVLTVSSG